MKSAVAFAAVLAVASAQFVFPPINSQYVRPTFAPSTYAPTTFASPTFAPSTVSPYRYSTVAPAVINRVVSSDGAASIVRYDSDVNPDGSYSYGFETDNGISAQEQGVPRDFGGNPPSRPIVVQGSNAYTSPEGKVVAISYIADENGYQPSGDVIPTPHPIPPLIARALEYIARTAPVQKK